MEIGEAAFVFNAVIDADKIQVHLPTLEMMQMNQATLSSSRIKNGKFKIAIIVNSTDALDLNDEDGSAKDKYNVLFRWRLDVKFLSGHMMLGRQIQIPDAVCCFRLSNNQ